MPTRPAAPSITSFRPNRVHAILRASVQVCAFSLAASFAGSAVAESPGASERPGAAQDDAKAPATAPPQEQIDRAIDRGLRYLLSRQEIDGSWRPDEHRYITGQTALSVYTLLKGGLPPSHPSVKRGLAFIRTHPPQWTYETATSILALCAASKVSDTELIEAWIDQLLDAHGKGFSYPGKHEDLSLTQYGCLALRAAGERGIEVGPKTWRDLIDFAMRVRKDDGGFSYIPGGHATISMTSAGAAVLAIAQGELERLGKSKVRESRELDTAIQEAIDWLGRHFAVDRNNDPTATNPGAGHIKRWHLYALYGLERVGGLTAVAKFGDHDWYAEAAAQLVSTQKDQGQWSTSYGESHPGTCFGVLVLKRATAPSSGKNLTRSQSYGGDDPAQPASLRITGDTPLVAWISSFGTDTLAANEWEGEIGDGPRVLRVEYVNVDTNEVLAQTAGTPDRPAGIERFAAKIRMSAPGRYKIKARVHLSAPNRPQGSPPSDKASDKAAGTAPGAAGTPVVIETPTVEVRVDAVMTAGMERALAELGSNLLQRTQVDVDASSTHGGKHVPRMAADGSMAFGWLCKKTDAAPWIELDLRRPQRGNVIAITPYYRAPEERADWGGAQRIEVRVNGKLKGTIEMPLDLDGKAYLDLGKRLSIRKIRLDAIEKRPGTRASDKDLCGVAEVELLIHDE